MQENNYCVYKHTAPNGKIYIGITSQEPEKRWNSGHGYKDQFFYRAIQKYGWINFIHEILVIGLTKEEACQKEIELIAFYKSNQPEFGYNIDNGGNCSGRLTVESKEKISNSLKMYFKKNGCPNKGRKLSDSQIQRLRECHLGRKQSEEEIKKRLRYGSEHWGYGKHRPHETKEKISNSLKGVCTYDHKCLMKKVCKYDLDNNLIETFDSLRDAALSVNSKSKHTKGNISACCLGKVKTAYGYIWRYLDETD